MVREKGLEPSRRKALAPKASVSTNSTTRAYGVIIAQQKIKRKLENQSACAMMKVMNIGKRANNAS